MPDAVVAGEPSYCLAGLARVVCAQNCALRDSLRAVLCPWSLLVAVVTIVIMLGDVLVVDDEIRPGGRMEMEMVMQLYRDVLCG